MLTRDLFVCALVVISAFVVLPTHAARTLRTTTEPITHSRQGPWYISGFAVANRADPNICSPPDIGIQTYKYDGDKLRPNQRELNSRCLPYMVTDVSTNEWAKRCVVSSIAYILSCTGKTSSGGSILQMFNFREGTWTAEESWSGFDGEIRGLAMSDSGILVVSHTDTEIYAYRRAGQNSWSNNLSYEPTDVIIQRIQASRLGNVIAATVVPSGANPAVYLFKETFSATPYVISQSLIPARTATPTFGSGISISGYGDEYITVTDAAEGKAYVFHFDRYEGVITFDSQFTIGAGSGNQISSIVIGGTKVFATVAPASLCEGGSKPCTQVYMTLQDDTWVKDKEFSSNETDIAQYADYMTLTSYQYQTGDPVGNYLYINSKRTGAGGYLTRHNITVIDAVPPTLVPKLTIISGTFIAPQISADPAKAPYTGAPTSGAPVGSGENINGNIPIDGFKLQYKEKTATEWVTKDVEGLDATLPCLRPGSEYAMRAAYVNDFGEGPMTAEYPFVISTETRMGFVTFTECYAGKSCQGLYCQNFGPTCGTASSPVLITPTPSIAYRLGDREPANCVSKTGQICCTYEYYNDGSVYPQTSCVGITVGATSKLAYSRKTVFNSGPPTSNSEDNKWASMRVDQIGTRDTVVALCGQDFVDSNQDLDPVFNDSPSGTGASSVLSASYLMVSVAVATLLVFL